MAAQASVVVEARGIEKAFRIPTHRIDSFKERFVHPFARQEYRTLRALRDVSFDIHRGEFFGIVGRNGSGKSTLLKILASIYRADAGTIRMAGRLAPFIELGVGFNGDLSARENVVLNGVMMGLSQREARRRLDAVLDYAELAEFVDLRLKNYSSGMLVRLAFAAMIQAEADILLIDEVLAVGDAAFQQKCRDTLRQMRDSGRTIVLVTHDMSAVEDFCHRAMLLDDGDLRSIGDAGEIGRQYLKMNFEGRKITIEPGREVDLVPDLLARLADAWLEDDSGKRITNLEVGQPINLRAVFEARRELTNPRFGVKVLNEKGVEVLALQAPMDDDGAGGRIPAQGRVRVSARIENQLLPGRYSLVSSVAVMTSEEQRAQELSKLLDFVVFGLDRGLGIVAAEGELGITLESTPEVRR